MHEKHCDTLSRIYYVMNILFGCIFLITTGILLVLHPDAFLPTMLDGAEKSATTCFALLSSYAVWLGLMRVWEDSGVAHGIARVLKPITKKLLKTENNEAIQAASMNFSVNLLGISGAATPYGIRAASLLDKTPNAEYSSAMLFVINATSLQIFPSSMIAVRVAMHSTTPYNIILPTILSTLFSTLLGILLTSLLIKSANKKQKSLYHVCVERHFWLKNKKIKGAGMR